LLECDLDRDLDRLLECDLERDLDRLLECDLERDLDRLLECDLERDLDPTFNFIPQVLLLDLFQPILRFLNILDIFL
jgi:hypothetical protein